MNACGHTHICFEHYANHGGRLVAYTCWNPECMGLSGIQGVCPSCSFYHGWAHSGDDINAMY